jgi:hypothetical protein
MQGGLPIMPFRVSVAVLTLAVLALPGFGQDKADLKWKFEKGKTFYQEMTWDGEQTLSLVGLGKVSGRDKQTIVASWTPTRELEDRSWIVKLKIIGLKIMIRSPEDNTDYDSTRRKVAASGKELADSLDLLIGAEFEQTIDKDLKVTKIEGYQELLRKLGEAGPIVSPMFSEQTLKEMSDVLFKVTPGKEVAKGESWSQETNSYFSGPGLSLVVQRNYTYAGTSDGLDEITLDSKFIKHEPPNAKGFRLKKLALKSFSATGTFRFNRAKGRLEEAETTEKVDGKADLVIDGEEWTVDSQETQKVTIRIFEKNPLRE